MAWDRRVKVGSSAAGVVALLLAGAWYIFSQAPTPKGFRMTPTSIAHPLLDRPLEGISGQPLLGQRRVPVLMVVPDQLPGWVRKDLKSHVRPVFLKEHQFLWDGTSVLFNKARGWSVSGLYPTSVLEWVPLAAMSHRLVNAWAKGHDGYSVGPLTPQRGMFVWGTPDWTPERLSWSTKLTRLSESVLNSGGALAVIDGEGRVRTLVANPNHRGIAWEPRPVGLGLVPPLTAEALGSQGILLKIKGSSNLLGQLANAWGAHPIIQGLRLLGMGDPTTLSGQPVQNPPLPKSAVSVMSQGHALWATPLEVARAYLPFVRQGLIPTLTASATPSTLKTQGVPLVATASNLNQVASVLPAVMADGLKFSVWRPDGNFAVAFSQADGGMVVVAEGPATQSILQLVHVVAGWMHQSHSVKKQGKLK